MRWARLVVALALPVVAASYLAADLWMAWRVPDADAWGEAALHVRSEWEQGDAVVFSPAWAWEGAPRFDGLDPWLVESVDWYEAGKHGRVWAVGPREPAPPAGWTVEERERDRGVTVTLLKPPEGQRLLFDSMARIGDARVTRIHKDRREPCTNFHDRRWDCGPRPEAWLYVGVERMDMGDAIREVIWAHPLDKGEPTEIRWPSIPAGRRLVIRYGLNQRAVDSSTFGVAPTFSVSVGGREVLVRDVEQGSGWAMETIDLEAMEGQPLDLAVTVSTPDFRDNRLCFTADVWE